MTGDVDEPFIALLVDEGVASAHAIEGRSGRCADEALAQPDVHVVRNLAPRNAGRRKPIQDAEIRCG